MDPAGHRLCSPQLQIPLLQRQHHGITPANTPQYLTASSNIWIFLLTALIILGGLFSIISYKDRRRQVWVSIGLIILSLVNLFLFYRTSVKYDGTYSLSAILPLAVPILFFLAIRGIIRDEKLIKSTDRLR